jgi:hypothetical protein
MWLGGGDRASGSTRPLPHTALVQTRWFIRGAVIVEVPGEHDIHTCYALLLAQKPAGAGGEAIVIVIWGIHSAEGTQGIVRRQRRT